MKKWFGVVLGVLLAIAILTLPLPLKVSKEYDGLMYAYGQYTEPTACKITIDGTNYMYLLKPDAYYGEFSISTDDRTLQGAKLHSSITKDIVNPLTYFSEQGYTTIGYFVSPDNLEWLYIRSKDADGEIYEIMASAENNEEALEIKQAAIDRLSLLPQLGADDK